MLLQGHSQNVDENEEHKNDRKHHQADEIEPRHDPILPHHFLIVHIDSLAWTMSGLGKWRRPIAGPSRGHELGLEQRGGGARQRQRQAVDFQMEQNHRVFQEGTKNEKDAGQDPTLKMWKKLGLLRIRRAYIPFYYTIKLLLAETSKF